MKIHSVYAEGFMLFKRFKKVYGDKEVIGIMAEYAGNKKKSNKGGKSTVVEMILWCLSGISRAEKETELIHKGMDHVLVRVVLSDNGRKFTVTRGRDTNNKGILELKGIEKKREAQEEINKLIGMKPEEMLLTLFFKQSDINQFMELKPAEKKKFLMAWLKNNHWSVLERMALDDLALKTKKLATLKAQRDALKEQSEDPSELKAEIKSLKSKLGEKKIREEGLRKKFDKINKQSAQQAKYAEEVQEIETELDELNEEMDDTKSAKELLSAAQVRVKNLKEVMPKIDGINEAKVRAEKAKLDQQIDHINGLIYSAEKDFTGQCPILKEPCDRIQYSNSALKNMKDSTCALSKKVKALDSSISKLEAHRNVTAQLTKQRGLVAQYKVAVEAEDAAKAKCKRLEARLSELKDKALDWSQNEKDLDGLEERLESVRQDIEELTEELGQLNQRLKAVEELKGKLFDLDGKIHTLEKYSIPRLRYVAFMFGKNGIPSQEIENAFDEIEDEINFVLRKLGTALEVEFRPDREVGTWEDFCLECGWQYPKGTRTKDCGECGAARVHKRKDELQLRVLENGEDEGFHMESGGGKTLISIAVRIAMTRLLQRQTGSNFNVVFLDEPDSAFDPVNRANFVKLITTTLIKHFGFEQVFWITHAEEFQEQVPDVLRVKRFERHSEATWA